MFSFAMKKGGSIASANFDRPEAASQLLSEHCTFVHLCGGGLREVPSSFARTSWPGAYPPQANGNCRTAFQTICPRTLGFRASRGEESL
jgi:hypothetical protein